MNELTVPTRKITLPKTQYTVEIREFIGTASVRKLQKILFGSGVKFAAPKDADAMSEQDLPKEVDGKQAVVWFDMQEEALRDACVAIYDNTQQKLVYTDPNIIIGNLPPQDGNALYEEINKLINESMMTNDAKKN